MTEAETIAAIRDAIVKTVAPRKIILFGSRARGDARPDSDYDLLVIVEPSQRPTWQVGVDARVAAQHIPVPMDLVVVSTMEWAEEQKYPWSVVVKAAHSGEVIYEAA